MLCPFVAKPFVLEASNVPRFLLVVVVLFFVFLSWLFQRRSLFLPEKNLLLLLAVYYLLNLLSAGWAIDPADAWYESQKVFLVPCLLILFLNWLQQEEEEKILTRSLLIIALLYIGYSAYQIEKLPNLDFETLYDVQAFAEHKNLLASFLFLLLVFPVLGLMYFHGIWRIISIFVFVFLFLLILFLQVRSVYLAVALTGLLLLIFAPKPGLLRSKSVLIISGCVLLFMLWLVFYSPLATRINPFTYSASDSGSERLKIWHKTGLLIQEHPLLGVGAGNWQYLFSKYGVGDVKNISQNAVSFQRPHNDLLWILSETGIIGFGLIVLMLLVILRKAYPALRARNFKVTLYFAFLCGLLADSFFSFPKERITHIFLASLLLALLLKQLDLVTELNNKRKNAFLLVCMLSLIFSGVIAFYRLKGEYYTQLALQEKSAGNFRATVAACTKAISAFYETDPTSTPIHSYLGWAYQGLGKKDSLLYACEAAYRLSPYDYEVVSNYGFALEKNGKREQARVVLREALRINPCYEPAVLNLFITEYNARNYEAAYTWLVQVPDYQQKYSAYYALLIQNLENKKGLR